MNFDNILVKIPIESPDYYRASQYVVSKIEAIIQSSIDAGTNQIFIYTNLKRGLPLENINKIAGPFIEAWALEQFEYVAVDKSNQFSLISVQAGKRLDAFDLILQFEQHLASIDVKATAEDIKTSGKSPNITSFARIRSEYLKNPDYIFIVLSLKHRVFSTKDNQTGMTHGVMEVIHQAVYDLKYISSSDLSYNPALGTGQLQIRDIHQVTLEHRTVWDFCQMIDQKYIHSRGKNSWLDLAKKHNWIEDNNNA